MQSKENLVWLDLEMTGLIPEKDTILEAAIVITDSDLNILEESLNLTVYHTNQQLESMSAWCIDQHGRSGLTKRVSESQYNLQDVETILLDLVTKYTPQNVAPLCGNSIHQDRLFLRKYMPRLTKYLHYRNIDVSSFRQVLQRWDSAFKPYVKEHKHTALEDTKESIAELAYYKEHYFSPIR